MKRVRIVTEFVFTYNDGKQERFPPGLYEFEDEIADHMYVRAHSDNPPPAEPPVGTPEYALAAAKKVQRRRILEAAIEEQALDEVRKTHK